MKIFGKELKFNGKRVYHENDKPTPSEIGAAAASHGTHVTYSTTAPLANGTASAGSASTVARTDHVHPLQTTISGNAGTATKLQTGRTLTVGSTGKSFDGSANVSWSLNEIGAATGKTASATTAATAQWYRIATSPVGMNRCIGNFTIEATVSGKHSVTNLIAGVNYGINPTIQQIAHSDYSAPGITKARIVYHTTYNNNYAYLEVYQPTATATQINVSAVNLVGWTLVTPNTVGSIPSGYTSKEITFVNNKIVANIQGSVSGSSSSATKATQDSAGQQINTTYIKGLSVSGKTITYTKGDGTTGTITTQDTNTTYSTGTASTAGLTKLYTSTGTATDGTMTQAAINSALGGKANSSHTHSSLTGASGSTAAPSTGTGVMRYDYNVSSSNAGSLPNSNNANGILTLNTHSGNYYNQLGFSSNGNLYYRAFNNVALDTTTAWKQIAFTNSSITGNAGTATKLQTARTINGTSFNGSGNITTANWGTARNLTIGNTAKSVNGSANVSWSLSEIGAAPTSHTHNIHMTYGTCSTEAATAEKVVSIVDSNWELKTGSVVMIKFTVTNTASNVKLNVNGTGAYPIWYNNAEYTGNSNQYCGYANRVTTYMFNGTHWVWIANSYDANSTYSNASLGQGYATCDTAEATAAKVATLSSYALTTGGIVSVKFTYAVPASATLNINSKGAKAIYFRGSAIKANIIKAGDIATFIYNGSQYHLISIDRWQSDIDTNKTNISSLQAKVNNGQVIKVTEDNGACRGVPNNNANDINATGFWMGLNVVNAPQSTHGWVYIESLMHDGSHQVQKATDLHNSSKRWTRHKTSGKWSEWREL